MHDRIDLLHILCCLLAKYFSTEQSVKNLCCCLTVLTAKLLSKVYQRETEQHKTWVRTHIRQNPEKKTRAGETRKRVTAPIIILLIFLLPQGTLVYHPTPPPWGKFQTRSDLQIPNPYNIISKGFSWISFWVRESRCNFKFVREQSPPIKEGKKKQEKEN